MAKARLSIILEDVRGKAGPVVFAESRQGLVVKPRITPANPDTAAQQSARSYFGRSASAFKNMSVSQANAWENYAQTIHKETVTGKKYNPTGISAFIALSSKFLQVTPAGTIPLTPPSTGFTGDNISITATAGTGVINVTSSGANTANCTTEILLQPLASPHVNPQKGKFRHKEFVSFPSGSSPVPINVGAGWYAVAYRFVNKLTGQVTQPVQIPLVQVSLSVTEGGTQRANKAA